MNEDSIALSGLVGKIDYIFIDFWASWCGSFLQFLSDLKVFDDKHNAAQFTVLHISLDDNKEVWAKTVAAR